MKSSGAGAAEVLPDIVITMVRRRRRDISLTSSSVLGRLDHAGPRRLGELAQAERVTQPSMSAIVAHLESLGLVERKSDPSDGRAVMVGLTPAGRKYLRGRRLDAAAGYRSLIAELSLDERAALEAAVPALTHLLELATAPVESAEVEAVSR